MPVPAPPRPFIASPENRRHVRQMFSDIAPSYDLLNHLLSLNIDRWWRRRALARLGWQAHPAGIYLDACAGTLDLASLLSRRGSFRGKVAATDFALPMLRLGTQKRGGGAISCAAADTLMLPFEDGTFDGATIGFGLRNLVSVETGFVELARVLKAGARLVVLDCSTPPFAPLRALYSLYFRRVLPLVGRMISGHPTAYTYLPESVVDFPSPQRLESHMAAAGLMDTGHELLTGGIAAVTWGTR